MSYFRTQNIPIKCRKCLFAQIAATKKGAEAPFYPVSVSSFQLMGTKSVQLTNKYF